ncbi:MAG: sugar ABC transporter permease [Spirochaetia bacterium]|nr:sugar ABC transporter permease [Spirochaetia bacterium]MCF7940060.1 sugar ABC transporter permease [Spirochaetia bacterium]
MYTGTVKQNRRAVIFFLFPAVAALVVFFLLPIGESVIMSLLDYDPLKGFSAIKFVGLENFKRLYTTKDLAIQFRHVLYYMVLYIPLVLMTSMSQALMLNKDFAGKKLYKILFYLPVISSWVAVALIWKWLLNGKYGLINNWLMIIGIQGPSWIRSQVWAMPGVVLAAVWKDTGYYALILLAALKGIDKNYYEAARIDGAGAWQRFKSITMPLISPTLFLLVIINVINGFQVFESIYIMTEGGPAGATRVPVEQIYRNAFTYYNMGYASALAWALAIVIFSVTVVQFSFQKKWVTYEG